ncbi:MAG: deaminase [Armatimonadota bacterium]
MTAHPVQHPQIIGLTGSFGSGCSYIAENIISQKGYRRLSLSDILKSLYHDHFGKAPTHRHELQQFGDDIRREYGSGYLAEQIIASIDKDASNQNKWVVDSIRNPEEIQVLRNYSRNFFLFGVFADKELRWDRVSERYENDKRTFDQDDRNDTGSNSDLFGQRVSDCFYEADIVIANEDKFSSIGNTHFQSFAEKIYQYITLTEQPLTRSQALRPEEAIMAMAYAISQRSSCLQRKVGAIITDDTGNVISTGFNEVPNRETPCRDEHGQCYRRKQYDDLITSLINIVPTISDKEDEVRALVKQRFRILDKCRALHAEENAIVNLARQSRASTIGDCTLYTTTYPCRLCANKISQLGIKRVVYLEPYPDEEAKVILTGNGVNTIFFEGITFRAYFRIYGEKR